MVSLFTDLLFAILLIFESVLMKVKNDSFRKKTGMVFALFLKEYVVGFSFFTRNRIL